MIPQQPGSPLSPPSVVDGVWPPPPVVQPQPSQWDTPFVPFKYLYRRGVGSAGAKAPTSDFREGVLFFDEYGVIIDGKACPRAEVRYWVSMPFILLGLLVAAVVHYVMEYAVQHPERIGVRWDQVRHITVDPAKSQGCIVYDAPNYKGDIRTFSLGLTITPGYEETLRYAARTFIPDRFQEARLRNATLPGVWIFIAVFFAALIGIILFAALRH